MIVGCERKEGKKGNFFQFSNFNTIIKQVCKKYFVQLNRGELPYGTYSDRKYLENKMASSLSREFWVMTLLTSAHCHLMRIAMRSKVVCFMCLYTIFTIFPKISC